MRRHNFRAGVLTIAPILIGVVPFGVIAGVAAVESGLSSLQAIVFSPVVFAGASQLAAYELIGRDAAIVVIALTVLVINSRFVMYSASLAPHFVTASVPQKLAAPYLLTDQAFAASIIRYGEVEEPPDLKLAYYFGAALALWTTWQSSTIVGVVVGSGIPPEWSLDFAIPLVFVALLFPAITDRATSVAAVVGGLTAVAAQPLAYNLGLPLAAMVGIAAGLVAESRR
ncbi:MAG: AzlC family ABC transporter permease [Acidimicrobiia bacterium]|nr:AzlC family ABC transporter permease [Acidimicrobiia bacterium]